MKPTFIIPLRLMLSGSLPSGLEVRLCPSRRLTSSCTWTMYDIHIYIVCFTHSCDRLGSNRRLLNQPKISEIGSRFSLIFPGGYIRRLSFLVSRQRTL